ncbi:MAG: FlgD immunoglobulin-like domain containing protein [bacterium]
MRTWVASSVVLLLVLTSATLARATGESWRYYRPGNTGIQGDYNEAIFIDADGDPWIGGYNPTAEEGGVAKFIQAENRWINVSNIDYPVIGSANDVGVSRVTDMVADQQGNLWMGTWRGALRMNLAAGPSSLVRFGPGNSALPGGLTRDIALAPDGSIWISAESTIWAGGGLTRYNPATKQWTHMNGRGGSRIAAQPKPGGGYYIWSDLEGYDGMERWDSVTNTWTTYSFGEGQPASLQSQDAADEAGNVWMTRWFGNQGEEILDCIRPNGTWVTPPLPPRHPQVPYAAVRAFGNMQALLVDGYADLYRFDGTAWINLGPEPASGFITGPDIDAAGNIWLSGTFTGGVFRRDAETGVWQRYRVTNTSQFDLFNNDVAIDPQTGDVYACANAGPAIGGMVKFDGTRWTGFVNQDGYGLTEPWPWPGAPQSEAVYVRPSNGRVVANPINQFTHEFDGTSWTQLPGGQDQMRQYVEDSLGRLWGIGHYGGLWIFEGDGILVGGGGASLQSDPDRPGTIWCASGAEILRTDGTSSFTFSMDDVPELGFYQFQGLAVDHNDICWVGATDGTSGALIRIDANTGTHEIWQSSDADWPFPTPIVTPGRVTPDGRVWMVYNTDWPFINAGLLWWDGTQVGLFPAPPNGEWQWGGMPHYIVLDMEVNIIPEGYELWMSCASRGIAVLTIPFQNPVAVDEGLAAPSLALLQNSPNPFRSSTTLHFSLPRPQEAQVSVFDVSGRLVRTLVDRRLAGGEHQMTWDGTDQSGRAVTSGTYFYKLITPERNLTRKMSVIR